MSSKVEAKLSRGKTKPTKPKDYGYKVKSNNNPEDLGMSKTLDERLIRIAIWFEMGEIDAKNYLWCLEKAFEHWGWTPPQ